MKDLERRIQRLRDALTTGADQRHFVIEYDATQQDANDPALLADVPAWAEAVVIIPKVMPVEQGGGVTYLEEWRARRAQEWPHDAA